jgi:hypothetical protein
VSRSPEEELHPQDDLDDASVAEALERARRHARAALAEALAAARALLDAAALGVGGVRAEDHGVLSLAATALDRAAEGLGGHGDDGRALATALATALDAEIARWELRAGDDPEARAVLRAFLGLRELLWELGFRRSDETRGRAAAVVRRGPRVQRVDVQG